jgi:predicted amidophosphoribosyltransferase
MTRPTKRLCPVCGQDAKKGQTVCKTCGYNFAGVTASPGAAVRDAIRADVSTARTPSTWTGVADEPATQVTSTSNQGTTFCPSCGQKNEAGDWFCRACGTRLTAQLAP